MSQQTVISVVIPKFQAFIQACPHVQDLAQLPEEQLRQLWAGLGYYTRARNLKRGAQYIVDHYPHGMPKTQKEWLNVPGCGPYTASIIASICFGEAVPAVDGNVIRVASRLLGLSEEAWTRTGQKRIQSLVEELIPAEHPGDFNQALMDLGATICKKQNPLCHECPFVNCCTAFAQKRVALCPSIKPRKAEVTEDLYAVIGLHHEHLWKVMTVERASRFLKKTAGFPLFAQSEMQQLQKLLKQAQQEGYIAELVGAVATHHITHHKLVVHAWMLKPLVPKTSSASFFPQWFYQRGESAQWTTFEGLNLSSSLDRKVWDALSWQRELLMP